MGGDGGMEEGAVPLFEFSVAVGIHGEAVVDKSGVVFVGMSQDVSVSYSVYCVDVSWFHGFSPSGSYLARTDRMHVGSWSPVFRLLRQYGQ